MVFIGSGAFTGCDGKAFTRFAIPDSVREMGKSAFYGCTNLSNVSFGRGLAAIPDDCFGNCQRLTDISLPDSVRSIGNKAFYNCDGLQFVDLNGVETVGKDAFYSTSGTASMEFIVLGENMNSLGNGAFGNCKHVTELEIHCSYFASFENAFTNVDVDSFKIYASGSSISRPKPQKPHLTVQTLVKLMLQLLIKVTVSPTISRRTASAVAKSA